MAEIKTLKEVEGALPAKKGIEYVRALDAQGNPIRISKADLAEVLGGLLPLVSSDKNGFISRSINPHIANTNKKKAVLLHKCRVYGWIGFSFILAISAGTSGITILFVGGGFDGDTSDLKTAFFNKIAGNANFGDYAKIMYSIKGNVLSIYLTSISDNVTLGGRTLYKVNCDPSTVISSNMEALETFNREECKEFVSI